MALESSTSWSFHWNPGFTPAFSWMDSPVTHHLASDALWNHGGRLCNSPLLVLCMPSKPVPCGQHYLIWLPVWHRPFTHLNHIVSCVCRLKQLLSRVSAFTGWKLSLVRSCLWVTFLHVPKYNRRTLLKDTNLLNTCLFLVYTLL